jgi:hypothetical protein
VGGGPGGTWPDGGGVTGDGCGTAAGVPGCDAALLVGERRDEGESWVLLAPVPGAECETGEPPMVMGTAMAAATSAASAPTASNAQAGPGRFLRCGWAPVSVERAPKAASVGVRRAFALVIVGGAPVLPVAGGT